MVLLDNALLDHVLSFVHPREFPHSILLVNTQMNKVGKPYLWKCLELYVHDDNPNAHSTLSYRFYPFELEKGYFDNTFVLEHLESCQLIREMSFIFRPIPGWLEKMLPVIMCNVSEVTMSGEDTLKYLEFCNPEKLNFVKGAVHFTSQLSPSCVKRFISALNRFKRLETFCFFTTMAKTQEPVSTSSVDKTILSNLKTLVLEGDIALDLSGFLLCGNLNLEYLHLTGTRFIIGQLSDLLKKADTLMNFKFILEEMPRKKNVSNLLRHWNAHSAIATSLC
jgi:hypothetical protein